MPYPSIPTIHGAHVARTGLALFAALSILLTATLLGGGAVLADEHAGPAALKVEKHDPSGEPLAGAVFTVESQDGTFTTGDDGSFCITGLPKDAEYTVTEIEAPDGYRLADPASQRVDVDNDGDCDSPDAVFVNEPTDEGPGEDAQGTVMIMKHVCPDEIQSVEQFDALGGFLQKVLACPVITLPGDSGPDGALDADDDFFDQFVEGGTTDFNFSVMAANGSQTLGDATFVPAKVCETDLNADANGDGQISADVCVEVSNYAVDGVTEGSVTVTESMPPAGFRFGDIEFSPNSGDEATLVSLDASAGRIELDTTADDGTSGEGEAGPDMVMVHVYNFANVDDEGPAATPAPTGDVRGSQGGPGQGQVPDTAVATPSPSAAFLLGLVALFLSAVALTARGRVRPVRIPMRRR